MNKLKTKKGGESLSFPTIVIAALCLIALIVLATTSSGLIDKLFKKLFGLGEEAQPETLKRSCLYNGGYCTTLEECKNTIIPKPSEGWEGSCEICCKS